MKAPLLAFLALLTFLASCKKTYCWQCTTTQTEFRNGIQGSTFSTQSQPCGMTGADIEGYEQLGTQTTTRFEGADRITTVVTRTCTR